MSAALDTEIDGFLAMLPGRYYTREAIEVQVGRPARASLGRLVKTGRVVQHDDGLYQSADPVPVLTEGEAFTARALWLWLDAPDLGDTDGRRLRYRMAQGLSDLRLIGEDGPSAEGAALLDRARKAEVL